MNVTNSPALRDSFYRKFSVLCLKISRYQEHHLGIIQYISLHVHIVFILYFLFIISIYFYFIARFIYFTTKNIQKATITKSINLAKTFPYNIHLKDKSSNFSIFNLLKIGANIKGVIRSSINDFVRSQTFVAIINQIVTPITL